MGTAFSLRSFSHWLTWAVGLLALVLALSSGPLRAQGYPTADNPPGTSFFERTIAALEQAPPELRSEFAAIALYYLSEAYWAEASKAKADAESGNRKLNKWARAVQQQAQNYASLQEAVSYGMPVRLAMPRRSDAIIEVGDRRVLLTHPRPAQQSALEALILQDFCQQSRCYNLRDLAGAGQGATRNVQAYNARTEPAVEEADFDHLTDEYGNVRSDLPAAASTAVAAAAVPLPTLDERPRIPPAPPVQWEFNDRGARCMSKGVQLVFRTQDHIAETRPICEALFQEINTALAELRWQNQHGVFIDWQRLHIVALPDGGHQLVFNSAQDSALAKLPILARNPELLLVLRSWLARQLGGGTETVILDADNYAFIVTAN